MQYDPALAVLAGAVHPQLKGHVSVALVPGLKHEYECHKHPSELKVEILLHQIDDVSWVRRAFDSALRIRRNLALANLIRGEALPEEEEN
jgi:hypothetical protein